MFVLELHVNVSFIELVVSQQCSYCKHTLRLKMNRLLIFMRIAQMCPSEYILAKLILMR